MADGDWRPFLSVHLGRQHLLAHFALEVGGVCLRIDDLAAALLALVLVIPVLREPHQRGLLQVEDTAIESQWWHFEAAWHLGRVASGVLRHRGSSGLHGGVVGARTVQCERLIVELELLGLLQVARVVLVRRAGTAHVRQAAVLDAIVVVVAALVARLVLLLLLAHLLFHSFLITVSARNQFNPLSRDRSIDDI